MKWIILLLLAIGAPSKEQYKGYYFEDPGSIALPQHSFTLNDNSFTYTISVLADPNMQQRKNGDQEMRNSDYKGTWQLTSAGLELRFDDGHIERARIEKDEKFTYYVIGKHRFQHIDPAHKNEKQ